MPIDDLWRTVACSHCRGYGVIATYSAYDFEGPGECSTCDGSGRFFIRPGGQLFQYPGGPAAGMWPEAYDAAMPFRPAAHEALV